MKKIFITILLAALMPFAAGAQDARQRTAETIVADALAQLPAQTPKAFDSLMQELAATGADGIRMMAAMLVPAAEGKNAPVEYAINGVVSYVTAAGREELAREIRAGLTDAVAASTDKPNQAFLLSQLQLCATAAEAPVFVKYAADEYLADYAVRGLISTPGTDGEILALIDASPAPDALLAYAAAEKRLAAAEPALLKWAADPKTGTPTKEAVYNALAKCGMKVSHQVEALFTVESGEEAAQQLLQAAPKLDAVWNHDDDQGIGVMAAFNASGRDEFIMVGGAGSADMMELIKADNTVVKATTVYPSTQAADGVRMARLLAHGKAMADLVELEVPRQIMLYAPVVTKENVDQFLPSAFRS